MSDPERNLWRAVLVQAFEDAEMAVNDGESGSEPFESSRARQYLRAENFEEAEHLKLVCEFADIPADSVIFWARRRYRVGQTCVERVECGGAVAAFLTAEVLVTSEERELCPRIPQDPASLPVASPA